MTTEVATLPEAIRRHRSEASQATYAAYCQLVAAVATAGKVDPADADKIMRDAGKSDADLARDVERHRQRASWAEQAARIPDLQNRAAVKQQELATASAEWERIARQRKAAFEALYQEVGALQRQLAAAEQARAELLAGSFDPAIVERENALTVEVRNLEVERERIESELGVERRGSPGWSLFDLGRRIADAAQSLAKFRGHPSDAANAARKTLGELQTQRDAIERSTVKAMRGRLSEIAARKDAIARELADLAKTKVQP